MTQLTSQSQFIWSSIPLTTKKETVCNNSLVKFVSLNFKFLKLVCQWPPIRSHRQLHQTHLILVILLIFFENGIEEKDLMGFIRSLIQLLTDGTNDDLKEYKLSISVYLKQQYRYIQADGYNNINKP